MIAKVICLTSYKKYLTASRFYGEAAELAAYNAVKTRMEFERLEKDGLVKIENEITNTNYDFSIFDHIKDKIDRLTAIDDIFDRIEKEGLWCYVAFYRALENEDWKIAGSLDSILGNEFHYSGFDTALMEHAIDCYYDQFKYYAA